MQLSNAPGKLLLPFANSGAKNTIPTASQIGISAGAASLTDGFPPLTRTPIAAGGVPPSGLDMNGILYALSAALRWANAGGGYVYDGTFANDSNVGGYPKGARVLRSDGAGYWLNTIDGNTVDPESVTVNAAQVAGWVPELTNGIAAITLTSANVTLTPAQYGKPLIVLSGVLTANLNLIFPNLAGEWTVVNNCTGAFTVTAKTAAGTGVRIPSLGQKHIIYGDGTDINEAADRGFLFTPPVSKKLPVTLTAADANGLVYLGGSGAVTMPAASAVSNGYTFTLFNTTLTTVTINRAGADQFAVNGGRYVDSITLQPGDAIVIAALSASPWLVIGGTGANRYAGSTIVGAASGYTSVTGSRAIGPIYTNTTGRPLIVSVTIMTQAAALSGCRLIINGAEIAQYYTPVDLNTYGYLQGIVPPGATYQVTQASGDNNTLMFWREL